MKRSKFPSPGVIRSVPLKKTITGRGKPELTHWMFTGFPLFKQLALGIWSSEMTTGTAGNKRYELSQDHQLFPMRASVPGCVTNTDGTSLVPAALVSVALYVPLLAELAVMARVKL